MRKEQYMKVYRAWTDMRYKCNNSKSRSYKNFGAKGISYSPEWENYEEFRKDMLPSYLELVESGVDSSKITLGRIKTDSDFSWLNCKWMSTTENMNTLCENKFHPILAEKDGLKYTFMTTTDFAKFCGVTEAGVRNAMRRGKTCVRGVTFTKISQKEYYERVQGKV